MKEEKYIVKRSPKAHGYSITHTPPRKKSTRKSRGGQEKPGVEPRLDGEIPLCSVLGGSQRAKGSSLSEKVDEWEEMGGRDVKKEFNAWGKGLVVVHFSPTP